MKRMKEKNNNKEESAFGLVAADMDGTLLNPSREITKYTQDVIKEMSEIGIVFVPSTGRAINALPKELKEMDCIRYGIFSNGATVYDRKEKKILYQNHFDAKRVLELIRDLRKFDLMISVICNGQSYGERQSMENIDYYELDENMREIVLGSRKLVENVEDYIKQTNRTVEKITVIFRTLEEGQKVRQFLDTIDDIQFSSSLPKNVEISKKGCNKGDALSHLTQILKIYPEKTMAFGDADNDKELLEAADFSVVMENGLDSMKAIADYITDSNAEDGVAKAIEKFILKK